MPEDSDTFAVRLRDAATRKGMPKRHLGAVKALRFALESRFNITVAEESVRRWLHGDTIPTRANMERLAELLDVTVEWLATGRRGIGSKPLELNRDATAPGHVNALAGFITMDGGHVSFPHEEDTVAKEYGVNIFSIIAGRMHRIHVAESERVGGKFVRFRLPPRTDDVVVLGVMRARNLCLEVFRVPKEVEPDDHGFVIWSDDQIQAHHIDSFARPLV